MALVVQSGLLLDILISADYLEHSDLRFSDSASFFSPKV